MSRQGRRWSKGLGVGGGSFQRVGSCWEEQVGRLKLLGLWPFLRVRGGGGGPPVLWLWSRGLFLPLKASPGNEG